VPMQWAGDRLLLQRSPEGVALAGRVTTPNGCRVYDLAGPDRQPFLTMEFVDGEDLAALLRRVGRLPEEKAVEVARQLCSALAAVHEQGLLHRDLKPANVMLDGRGQVRLADFGLTGAAGEAGDARPGRRAYGPPGGGAGRGAWPGSALSPWALALSGFFPGRRASGGPAGAPPP